MPIHRSTRSRQLTLLTLIPFAAALTACGTSAADSGGSGGSGVADEVRLGYFANVTHAAALVAVQEGLFAEELGATTLTTQVFNAGPDVVEAVFAGALPKAMGTTGG